MWFPTQPNANGRLFPVPKGTVAMGGEWDNLRSQTTPSNQPAVPSPPATYRQNTHQNLKLKKKTFAYKTEHMGKTC